MKLLIKKVLLLSLFLGLNGITVAQDLEISILKSFTYSDTIHVPIYLDSVAEVGAITTAIKFDSTALTFIDIEAKQDIPGVIYHNHQADSVIIAWFSLIPITQSDTFAILKFARKDTACEGEITWTTISNQLISTSLGVPITTKYTGETGYFIKAESPTILQPTANMINTPVNAFFHWQNYDLSCVAAYRYQLATDSTFTQLTQDILLQDTTILIANLQALYNYYWRVGKVDAVDHVYWSAGQTFTTKDFDTISTQIEYLETFADTISVPITLQNTEFLSAFDLAIEYDTTTFEYFNYQTPYPFPLTIIDTIKGKITLSWAVQDTSLLLPSDTLLTLQLIDNQNCNGVITWDTTGQWGKFYFYNQPILGRQFEDGEVVFLDSMTPALQFPLDGSTQVFIRPNMQWTDINCTNSYHLQLAFDSLQTDIVLDTLLSDTLFTPTTLEADTTYYWRVGRFNEVDSFYWSSVWSFQTEEVLPVFVKATDVVTTSDTFSFPIMIDSLENTIAFDLQLRYDTSEVTFLNFFDTTNLLSNLQVQQYNGQLRFSWQSIDSTLLNTAAISSDTLVQVQFRYLTDCQTNFEWQVDSSDFYHLNDNINIDAVFNNSTTIFLTPSYPELLLPLDSTVTLLYPTLEWQTTNCVADYQLQVALDSQFVQIVLDTTQYDTTLWFPQLQPNTNYYWRVAKIDYIEDVFWSDTFQFRTIPLNTTTLTVTNKLTYQNATTLPIILDSAFYFNGFQLQIDYTPSEVAFSGFSSPLFSTIQVVDNGNYLSISWQDTTQLHFITQDTLLLLQFTNVSACQSAVTWNPTNSQFIYPSTLTPFPLSLEDGSVEFLNPFSPILTTPFDGETGVPVVIDFTWQSVACTESYQFQLATDAAFTQMLLDTTQLTNTFLNGIPLNHQTTYYWRVGRWDSQGDVYWSTVAMFTTQALLIVSLEATEAQTYQDTLSIAITIADVIQAQAFDLFLEYDTTAFQYLGYSDTLFDIIIGEHNGLIQLNWFAQSLAEQDLLTLTYDTLVHIYFTPNANCFSPIAWNQTLSSVTYKDDFIPIFINYTDGSLRWVNDDVTNLIFPPNDTTFMTNTFQIQWQAIACATGYHLQIYTDSTLQNLLVEVPNIETNSFAIFGLEHNRKYYWRIGQYDYNEIIHWSALWNFTTDRLDNQILRFSPNPTSGQVTIWFNQPRLRPATLTIYNSIGQLMGWESIAEVGKSVSLDLTRFKSGIYLIRFDDGELKWTEKIIVQH